MNKPFSFSDTYKQAEKDYGIGGSGFKVKEGDNRIRVLSECLPHPGSYQGKPNFKFLCYVLDRSEPVDKAVKIKTYFMPTTIFKAIEAYQKNPDYAFDEVPMPYDITINAKGAGNITVEYTVMPSPKLIPLTEAETTALAGMKSIQEVQDKIREKEMNNPEPQGEDDVNAELAGK